MTSLGCDVKILNMKIRRLQYELNKYIQKSCCFYASDWHLTVMLLLQDKYKAQENCGIYMKCENNIEEKQNILVNKLTLKIRKNIMNINWGNLVV